MTETAKRLLDTFDSLPEQERQKVVREILRRTALAEHPSLEDAELLAGSHSTPKRIRTPSPPPSSLFTSGPLRENFGHFRPREFWRQRVSPLQQLTHPGP